MRLTQITLDNFRNYSKAEVAINSDLVLILGENASGKTNFLESIYYLSALRSFRAADQVLVKKGEDFFRVGARMHSAPPPTQGTGSPFMSIPEARTWGEIGDLDRGHDRIPDPGSGSGTRQVRDGLELEAIVQTKPVLRRAFKINGQKVSRQLWRSFAAVLFIPPDLNLFSLGPSLRRRFLDETLAQTFSEYAADLVSLDYVLKQRKALLEQLFERRAQESELGLWDEQLAEISVKIDAARSVLAEFLKQGLPGILKNLTGFENKFEIEYAPAAPSKEEFLGQLRKLRPQEIRLGQNLAGPHREDFMFKKDGEQNLNNSSQGELRAQVLALKLLEARFLDQHRKPPIILLDDVFSELDETRRAKLLENLSGHQIFITSTEEHHLPKLAEDAQVLKVEENQIK